MKIYSFILATFILSLYAFHGHSSPARRQVKLSEDEIQQEMERKFLLRDGFKLKGNHYPRKIHFH